MVLVNILFRSIIRRSISSGEARVALFDRVFNKCNQLSGNDRASSGERIIAFYDGKCDLCVSEIRHYQNLLRTKDARIAFFDLAESPTSTRNILTEFGIPESAPFRRVHVVTEYKLDVLVSTEAFCEIWSRVPYWHRIVPFVRNVPGVRILSDLVYACIAETRLKLLPSNP